MTKSHIHHPWNERACVHLCRRELLRVCAGSGVPVPRVAPPAEQRHGGGAAAPRGCQGAGGAARSRGTPCSLTRLCVAVVGMLAVCALAQRSSAQRWWILCFLFFPAVHDGQVRRRAAAKLQRKKAADAAFKVADRDAGTRSPAVAAAAPAAVTSKSGPRQRNKGGKGSGSSAK